MIDEREQILFKLALGLFALIVMLSTLTYQSIIFDIEIGGHMGRAANANTIELAAQEMNIVVQNMEKRGMTKGYTSIIYKTPDEDVGYWYNNMNDSLAELRSVNPDATKLEKSNVLMKLRESLTTNDKIVVPQGIERFPYNALFAVYNLIFLITTFWGAFPGLKGVLS